MRLAYAYKGLGKVKKAREYLKMGLEKVPDYFEEFNDELLKLNEDVKLLSEY